MDSNRSFRLAVSLTVVLAGALTAAPALGGRDAPAERGSRAAAEGTSKASAKRGSKAPTKRGRRVRVMDNFFEPRTITIRPRQRVIWVWKGENSHNITFTKVPRRTSKRGASTRRKGRWSRKFWRRGYYRYVCTIHSGQRGSIEVGRRSSRRSRG